MNIYIDGSYKTKQCFTNSKFVSFTSAILAENSEPIIKDFEIKRCKNLRHYGNLAELTAAKLAIDYIKENKIERAIIHTDSQTLKSWVNSARNNKKKKFATKYNLEIYNFLIKELAELKIDFIWVSREQNKIGVILENKGYE